MDGEMIPGVIFRAEMEVWAACSGTVSRGSRQEAASSQVRRLRMPAHSAKRSSNADSFRKNFDKDSGEHEAGAECDEVFKEAFAVAVSA